MSGDWSTPQEVSDVTVAFPGDIAHLMPPMSEIPEEFHQWPRPGSWVDFQSKWFFGGVEIIQGQVTHAGVDVDTALRHLKAIQGSFQPKHEHKMAAVAYLASLWFKWLEVEIHGSNGQPERRIVFGTKPES